MNQPTHTTIWVRDDELKTLIHVRAHTIINAVNVGAPRATIIDYAERMLQLAEELPPDPLPSAEPTEDVTGLTKQ